METIDPKWLLDNGFAELPRLERQPQQSFLRCIAHECIGDKFMCAAEDMGLMLSPCDSAHSFWFCWLVKSASQVRHPHLWIHVRHLHFRDEVQLLYEGLTGRRWMSGREWDHRKWTTPLFECPKRPRHDEY